MIVILDYDMGNVGSIKNMLHRMGEKDVIISRCKADIKQASKIILPGVGSFDTGINNLNKYDLVGIINECVYEMKKPILGICLGMQMLGICSEEGDKEGLKFLEFKCKKFVPYDEYRVPHMGWNYVDIKKKGCALVKNLSEEQRYYFVHSYYVVNENQNDVLMTCKYGIEFTAAVMKSNIYGTQFHPEKSHFYGMELLKNFVKEC